MMRPLWLDYQRADPGRQRPGMLLLLVGALASVLLLAQYFSLAAATEEARAQVARLKRDAGRQQLGAGGSGAHVDRVAEPGTPAYSSARWDALFAALESAGDESVTLLGLQPGANEIKVAGEALNLVAAMDYLRRLLAAGAFSSVYLTQSEVVREHPRHPVRFALTAEWRGAEQ